MTKKHGKGWTKAGTYGSRKQAIKRAEELRGKFNHAIVQKGSYTRTHHGFQKATCYRVWVK